MKRLREDLSCQHIGAERLHKRHICTNGCSGRGKACIVVHLHDAAAEFLADVNNAAGTGIKLFGTGYCVHFSSLAAFAMGEDNTVFKNFHRNFHGFKMNAFRFCTAGLILAGGELVAPVKDSDRPGSQADGGSGAVHRRVTETDDDDPVAQMEGFRGSEVVASNSYLFPEELVKCFVQRFTDGNTQVDGGVIIPLFNGVDGLS